MSRGSWDRGMEDEVGRKIGGKLSYFLCIDAFILYILIFFGVYIVFGWDRVMNKADILVFVFI